MLGSTPVCYVSLLCLLLPIAQRAEGQRPLNLDFERASVSGSGLPWGWTFGWSAFEGRSGLGFGLDSVIRHSGRQSLRLTADSAPADSLKPLMMQLPAAFARGQELRLQAWLRAERLAGNLRLTLEAWKTGQVVAADTVTITDSATVSGPLKWTRYPLTLAVPADTSVHSVVLTASLDGPGVGWLDDFELTVGKKSISALPLIAAPPSSRELEWLGKQATPLQIVEVDSTGKDADLARFAEIVGDARVIALGESTHGTREFFQVKHRLIEYLVRTQGFRLFAIEANQLAVEQINRYVQSGEGTPQEVVRALFRVWNTEEMLGLIDWMRSWNQDHPDSRVQFVGYDMQNHHAAADSLRAFLERVEPTLLTRFDILAGEYRSQPSYATPEVPDSVRARWHRQIEQLVREVNEGRPIWRGRARRETGDTLAIEWALQAANLLRQAALFNVTLDSPRRDSLMAANLFWAMRTLAPDTRAVIWAHDVHVSRGGDSAVSFNQGSQMGAYLTDWFGASYRAFSLLTYEGRYSATRSLSDHTPIEAEAFPGPPGSLEAALHALKRPPETVGWVVDLRPARTGDPGAWLRVPRPVRHIGYAAYDYGFELTAVLPLEFDGVVFIDRSTPSRLLGSSNTGNPSP
jgi:erythromycin esterase